MKTQTTLFLFVILFTVLLSARETFHPSQLKEIEPNERNVSDNPFEPNSEVRALYLNRHTAKPSTPQFKKALRILEKTPMNALIIDMKNVRGDLTYRSELAEPRRIRASKFAAIDDIRAYVQTLKSRGIYLIARLAVFKDRRQARAFPSRAVRTPGGGVWRDRHGESWVDPFDPEARRYTLDIAEEVARLGFDEINFDYIRFPARRGLRYDRPETRDNRVDAIDTFLRDAQSRLHPLGVKVSADIFGYVLWNRTDTRIGQILEKMAPHVDYLYPMLYPSGFSRGSVAFSNPAAHPYEIVRISLQKGIARGVPAKKFRPWLQAFRDYAYSRLPYREREIAAQIRAAESLGSSGWLLWHPSSRFGYVTPGTFALAADAQVESPSVRTGPPFRRHRRHTRRPHPRMEAQNDTPRNPLDILRSR